MICPNAKCKREIPDDAVLCCYCGRRIAKQDAAKIHQRPNGMGTAFKRGKTWTAKISFDYHLDESGKMVHSEKTKGGFKTKIEALEYCAILKQQDEEKEVKRIPALSEYWDLYYEDELFKLSSDKRIAYKKAWQRLEALHAKPVNVITVADIRNAVSSSASTYYTMRDCKIVLSHLYKLAAADGFASKDLPSFIELPKLDEAEREPFSDLEQASLWRAYESGCEDAAIPLIMIYTGMMPGELMRLHSTMIDFDNRVIVGVGLKTKVRKESPVFFPADIAPVLEDAVARSPKEKVFAYNKDNFYKRYYAALDAAGVRRLSPYSCRHTTATALAINNNIAPETVRRLMRWSTTAMLQRYAHPDTKAMQGAIDTLTAK